MAKRLYLSFWEICLDNLPEGRFERRDISAQEAGAMIGLARAAQAFRGVTQDDLLAPYSKERKNHDALCAVLRDTYGIPMGLEDFLCNMGDEEQPCQTIMALQFARLEAGECLMVVNCGYRMGSNNPDAKDGFAIAEDSVEFSLIEALS
ncbi:MAG: hypothetical protein ACREU6_10000 [Steroidobacteraceae bacterium]